MSEFSTAFDGKIRTMPGEKFHIPLTENAKPFCVTTPRTVPFAYRDKLKQEIDLLISQEIIILLTEPTELCAPIAMAPKKDTHRIQMCVDLPKLNKFVRCECYPSTTPAQAVADIQQIKAKFFTVFDALKGYHQCPLDWSFGRFKYLQAPYRISSISEHYDRRMEEALAGVQDIRRIADDVIVFDRQRTAHLACPGNPLPLWGKRHIFQLWKFQVFAGFKLMPFGYSVSDDIIEAIAQFWTPGSRTDLRSFCGLVNQLASCTNDIAKVLVPLRPLLSSWNEFLWTQVHDEAFAIPSYCSHQHPPWPTSIQQRKHHCILMPAHLE